MGMATCVAKTDCAVAFSYKKAVSSSGDISAISAVGGSNRQFERYPQRTWLCSWVARPYASGAACARDDLRAE